MTLKHYAQFLQPGIIISDTSESPVRSRNPKKVKLGDYSFGFRFFDREESIVEGELLKGKRKNYSNWYYKGEVYDGLDVAIKVEDNERLLRNMKYNGYDKVVKTKFGQFIPLEKTDVVL